MSEDVGESPPTKPAKVDIGSSEPTLLLSSNSSSTNSGDTIYIPVTSAATVNCSSPATVDVKTSCPSTVSSSAAIVKTVTNCTLPNSQHTVTSGTMSSPNSQQPVAVETISPNSQAAVASNILLSSVPIVTSSTVKSLNSQTVEARSTIPLPNAECSLTTNIALLNSQPPHAATVITPPNLQHTCLSSATKMETVPNPQPVMAPNPQPAVAISLVKTQNTKHSVSSEELDSSQSAGAAPGVASGDSGAGTTISTPSTCIPLGTMAATSIPTGGISLTITNGMSSLDTGFLTTI